MDSIKLMNFLYQRKTPKNVNLTYESYTTFDKNGIFKEDFILKEAITKS